MPGRGGTSASPTDEADERGEGGRKSRLDEPLWGLLERVVALCLLAAVADAGLALCIAAEGRRPRADESGVLTTEVDTLGDGRADSGVTVAEDEPGRVGVCSRSFGMAGTGGGGDGRADGPAN